MLMQRRKSATWSKDWVTSYIQMFQQVQTSTPSKCQLLTKTNGVVLASEAEGGL